MDQLPFTPVPVRARHDGWTPERQHAFIAALAQSACVAEACRHVGKTPRAAYDLRDRPDAESFRAAWDAALAHAAERLHDAALGRALTGVAKPIFYRGQQIGEHRRFNDRLAMFLLRHLMPERYGRHEQAAVPADNAETRAARYAEAMAQLEAEALSPDTYAVDREVPSLAAPLTFRHIPHT